MDNHAMLTDIAFANLRCMRMFANEPTEDKHITIIREPSTNAEIQLEFLDELPKGYTPPTHLELSPIIYFSFNQIFNLIRTRPCDYNSKTQSQVKGIHHLLDDAHSGLVEMIDILPNPDTISLLEQYSDDILLKIEKIYERNVNMSNCRYVFEPLYNVVYYGAYNMISNLFSGRKQSMSRNRKIFHDRQCS